MSTQTIESPTGSPIINASNPIINAPIESPIINETRIEEDPNDTGGYSCGCCAVVPAGSRLLFIKFSLIIMGVCSVVMYGVYALISYM